MTHRKMAFGDKKVSYPTCLFDSISYRWQSYVWYINIWISHNPARCFDWQRVTPFYLEDKYPKQMRINKKIVPLGIARCVWCQKGLPFPLALCLILMVMQLKCGIKTLLIKGLRFAPSYVYTRTYKFSTGYLSVECTFWRIECLFEMVSIRFGSYMKDK